VFPAIWTHRPAIAVVILVNPVVNAAGRLPPGLNVAMTTVTTQAATITYSSDTTRSLSVLRRSNASRVLM
jgi:hypothetical protein